MAVGDFPKRLDCLLERNLVSAAINVMNVEHTVTEDIELAGARASQAMSVARRSRGECPRFHDSRLVTLHLHTCRAADHHYLLGGRVEMHRYFTPLRALYEKRGRAAARVSVLDRSRKACGDIREGHEFHIADVFDFGLRVAALSGTGQHARTEYDGDAEDFHVDLQAGMFAGCYNWV